MYINKLTADVPHNCILNIDLSRK